MASVAHAIPPWSWVDEIIFDCRQPSRMWSLNWVMAPSATDLIRMTSLAAVTRYQKHGIAFVRHASLQTTDLDLCRGVVIHVGHVPTHGWSSLAATLVAFVRDKCKAVSRVWVLLHVSSAALALETRVAADLKPRRASCILPYEKCHDMSSPSAVTALIIKVLKSGTTLAPPRAVDWKAHASPRACRLVNAALTLSSPPSSQKNIAPSAKRRAPSSATTILPIHKKHRVSFS
jgi:hypothetical protein